MRRGIRFLVMFALAASLSFAEGSGGESDVLMWKWANFVLLAVGLGYLMVKALPPLFASRSQAILHDLNESAKIRQDAEARAADVERRLAGLESEIAALRTDSQRQTQAETERIKSHTAAEIAKIQAQSEREIAMAGKAARTELKRYATSLAIDLAERKIRARITPAVEDGIVSAFVHDLK